jgi:hypothetical protein
VWAMDLAGNVRRDAGRAGAIVVALAIAGVVLTGLLLRPRVLAGPIVDGFPLATALDCATSFDSCGELTALARSAFDIREPHHPSVVSSTVYNEDINNPLLFDNSIGHARSGSVRVVVFDLADGSRGAAGVYCGVGGCVPLETYPH